MHPEAARPVVVVIPVPVADPDRHTEPALRTP
jgi:hypothetical protein